MGSETIKVAVVGASGYTGGELLRLLAGHPKMKIAAVTSEQSAGKPVAAMFPSLASVVSLNFEALAPDSIAKRVDAVFLALPHTKSLQPVAVCMAAGKHVVDLSADYRLKDPSVYETWYKAPHDQHSLLKQAVYGLPEFHREEIKKARLVASPGCYPTAAIVQLAPLVANGLIHPDTIVIDAKSGISGAGRSPALPYHFPEAHESLEAYKIGQHRHIPEIEQELSLLASRHGKAKGAATHLTVAFTPHLVPMNRGILSTAYSRLVEPMPLDQLRALYRDFYKGERFIRIHDGDVSANPRHVRGSNFCDVSVFADTRAGWVVTVAALDNLIKGAAGQAIQAMNLMLGFPEDMGISGPGVYP
ncbi:MAG: N-acetyl-gamma-glutamyl-phosphate reductase [Nitrospirae bacterium RIFCSPLOWO2_02_FULL_62_14]|nr:MAG: N-acetyl-gamma-glutamyl-phosphate reductase [Nitrospirae bacterium RIFCSPLOWO2_02_FULL_62_14]OGX06829.1 MAG: N-acetyl-gamma-glutamyl-phosphate reductase [Nitrospirae bacterium RIFCSPLOWO2_12_FULL_63_8]